VRSFAIGSVVAMTFALVPPSFFFVLALYLQTGRGYGPLFSGAVFALVGGGYFAAMLTAGRLAARLRHQVLATGATVVAIGCLALVGAAATGPAGWLAPGLVLVGSGIGLVLVPIASTVLGGVEPAHAGAAAGVLSAAQQVGGALGVAVVGTVFFASGPDVVHAFRIALAAVAALTVVTAISAQFLRAPRGPRLSSDLVGKVSACDGRTS
jgi:MFS family permease